MNRKPPTPGSRPELELLREKIIERVTRDPRKAAMILTEWIRQAAKPQKASQKPSEEKPKKKAG